MKAILLPLLLLCPIAVTRAEDGVPFPGPAISAATTGVTGRKWLIGNNTLAATFVREDSRIRLGSLRSPLNALDVGWTDPNLFTIYRTGGAAPLASSAMKLVAGPEELALARTPGAARLSKRLPGCLLRATFADEASGLEVQWNAILTDGANYLRQEIKLRPTRGPVGIDRIEMIRADLPGAQAAGYTDGSPFTTGKLFFGVEHPMARNTATTGDGWTPEEMQARRFDLPVQVIMAVPVTDAKWNGQARQSFTIGGHSAYVVVPAVAAPGNPWIWRTAWPDYHSEVDQELLRCGYHVGYIEVVDMLGSDASLDLMDEFYAQVRSQWKLAEKPAIEPNSLGGLHAYRYAIRHPERVACILGDVPVMDFKSWPLKHPASRQSNWQQVISGYGFKSDAEAMAYTGNPIDHLAEIAKAKIPIRHTICLADQVVPPEENTLEAKRRLQKLGWDLDVVAVKESDDCEGHHFPFPEAFASARFVMNHTAQLPAGADYFTPRDGLSNSYTRFATAKTGRVVFLGGSITYNPGWRDETCRYLQQKFPDTKFEFIATGKPSCGSVPHAFRLEQDVLASGPADLVFFEAAVNDASNITHSGADNVQPDDALLGSEGVVRHLRAANPRTDIVQMHFVQPEHLSAYHAGKEHPVIAAHEKVAACYGNMSINFAKEVSDRIDAGQMTWAGDFRDVHPSPFGQRLCSNAIMRGLDAAFDQAKHAAAKPHPLPANPLDARSFARGRFGGLKSARDLKGFELKPKGGMNWPGWDGPALEAGTAGSSFAFDFEGTACGLLIYAGADTGILEYRVDGGAWKKSDTFTPWSAGATLAWAIMLERDLKAGAHGVEIRLAAEKNPKSKGTALRVIELLEN